MGLYSNNAGVLTPIAGRGKAEYGASTVRTGTATIPQFETGDTIAKNVQVTFDSPMPDTDYIVNLEELSNTNIYTLRVYQKTVNGFTIAARLAFATTTTVEQGPINARSIYWKAFKLYTDNEYNDLLDSQKINDASVKETLTPIQYTPSSGTKIGSICYYYKKGTRVFFSLAVENVSSDSQLVFYQLPVGYRPYANIYTGTFQGTGAYIDTAGNVRGTPKNGNLYFNFTFDAFR